MFSHNFLSLESLAPYSREGYCNPEQLHQSYLKTKTASRSSRALKRLRQLNKKYFLNIWGVLFLVAVFLNLFLLQPIEWNRFSSTFSASRDKGSFGAFVAVMVYGTIFFLINDVFLGKWAFSIYISRTKTLREKISKVEWLKLLSITFFIRSITPFSIGSEPYIIFWLRKRGISLRQASAIVSSLTVSWLLAQAIITWPSFITLQVQHNLVDPKKKELKYSWMVIAGLIVDIVSTLFVFTISYCKRVHYSFGLIRLKFNQIFKIKSSTALSKAELKHKYLDNKSFKKEFKRVFFNQTTIKILLLFTVQNILNYSLYALLAILILEGDQQSFQSFLNSFHIINVSTTSNNFLPTPGSEGTIQLTITKMNSLVGQGFSSPQTQPQPTDSSAPDTKAESLNKVIFLWRWFQKYKPFLCSVAFLAIYFLIYKCRLALRKKKLKVVGPHRNISPELNAWYNFNDSLDLL